MAFGKRRSVGRVGCWPHPMQYTEFLTVHEETRNHQTSTYQQILRIETRYQINWTGKISWRLSVHHFRHHSSAIVNLSP
ncbi:hypothetical protein Plhal304r1_c062g0149051 [Plasmopara halstedii]